MPKLFLISSLVILLGLNSLCCLGGESAEQDVQPSEVITQPAAPVVIETATSKPQLEAPTAEPVPTDVPSPRVNITGTKLYTVNETVRVHNRGQGDVIGDMQVSIGIPRTLSPFQARLSLSTNPPDYTLTTDDQQNEYVYIVIPPLKAGAQAEIQVSYRVAVNGIEIQTGECQGELPRHDTAAEKYIESDDPQMVQLGSELASGKPDACAVTRSIYDHVRQNMQYENTADIQPGALETLKSMTGDYTEYSELMIALARAAGIPSVFVGGLTYDTVDDALKEQNKHSWVLSYLPNVGWAPIDPTLGRHSGDGDDYFAAVTPDHILISLGRNLDYLDGGFYSSADYQYYKSSPASVIVDTTWDIQLEP